MKNVFLISCALLCASSLFGQFETAEVLGSVHDPSGGRVVKAAVTLTNQGTSTEAKTSTDESGNYDFSNVKVGRYTVSVEAPGSSKVSATDIDVAVGSPPARRPHFAGRRVTESVMVTGAASVLETDSSEHSQVINTQQSLSCPSTAAITRTSRCSPPIIKSPIAVSFSPSGTPREGAFNVNGMRSTYNNFMLDGLDNNSYGTSNQGYSAS